MTNDQIESMTNLLACNEKKTMDDSWPFVSLLDFPDLNNWWPKLQQQDPSCRKPKLSFKAEVYENNQAPLAPPAASKAIC